MNTWTVTQSKEGGGLQIQFQPQDLALVFVSLDKYHNPPKQKTHYLHHFREELEVGGVNRLVCLWHSE